ncbi:beta-1,4-galactosyltransferase 6 [Hermetia illucens]|nr:beta-1,4-galactosyltransferase 6 [Hermetia illucens]
MSHRKRHIALFEIRWPRTVEKMLMLNTTIVTISVFTALLLFCIWPTRFAKHYDFIDGDRIYSALVTETTLNISKLQLDECEYEDILEENPFMYKDVYTQRIHDTQEIRLGGEYYPGDCKPRYSAAIIIPYRQREQQLNKFLTYMHNYLRKQRIHYRIFLIEQFDRKPFNRAKLFNIGSVVAAEYGFPCLILHDVDLMPLNLGQMYACTECPRHMCSSLDEFRFNLPYEGLFGGAVAIRAQQFRFINGMSNMFHGWGGEDDDLYGRIIAKNLQICRFAPDYSEYTMLKHTKEVPNADRLAFLRSGPLRYHTDGLNSLIYAQKDFKLHNLFTHVLVET